MSRTKLRPHHIKYLKSYSMGGFNQIIGSVAYGEEVFNAQKRVMDDLLQDPDQGIVLAIGLDVICKAGDGCDLGPECEYGSERERMVKEDDRTIEDYDLQLDHPYTVRELLGLLGTV